MARGDIGGTRLPRDRTSLTGFRAIRYSYKRIGLKACRAVMPGVPPFRSDYVTDLRLGASIDLISLDGIDALFDPVIILGLSGASPHQKWLGRTPPSS